MRAGSASSRSVRGGLAHGVSKANEENALCMLENSVQNGMLTLYHLALVQIRPEIFHLCVMQTKNSICYKLGVLGNCTHLHFGRYLDGG